MDARAFGELVSAQGPFVSVHFDDSHRTEDAGKQLRLRVKDITTALEEQKADAETVDAVVRAIEDAPPPVGESGRSLIAAGGEVLVDHRLAGPPPALEARHSALPYLVPLASHEAQRPPHVVVVADAVGADITRYGRDGAHSETVTGQNHPVHTVRGGGTAHKDLQNRSEETVKQNLEEVAGAVARAADHVGAEVVVLAGEVQARSALHELLPESVRRITETVEGASRAEPSGELDGQVAELLLNRRATELDDLAERFRAETGRESGLAVSGLAGVTAALSEASVETLLVGDPGDAMVFTGPEPAQVGADGTRLDALGVPEPSRNRADEALPYAAVATGANIVAMDERLPLQDGFGALLRHS
ncbi:Rv2629 family ribosome hibernation factor [Amycolatopsis jiangsuensis]|uniref:Peptide chain release factor 2 n=1 Tax=Amycolatopsis jiangsuensis TaxID=1181879 RepID=A0A840ILR9_9PSEU|nr:Vms1/Ankzf1 family peptidyl-tRNA hydrolase [Amycolatopsis jiangsuensis]MBB4683266.1 hypothetical protein [Amycolatopsis jiangsuensis]